MSSNYYNKIETEDTYETMPKKRFSLLGLLSKIRNACFLILLIIVVFAVWPTLHNESYQCFRLIIGLIFNREIFSLVVSNFSESFELQPVARSMELLALVTCIWKLILRGKILAFLQIKSIVMLTLASCWIYLLLFYALNITGLQIWSDYASFFIYSPMFCWLYPLVLDVAMKVYAVIIILIVCYLATVIFYGSSAREGQRLGRDDMEELGINDVMRRVNPIRKLFLPRPRFYVTDTFSQNAYSSGRNIVVARDVFGEGIEIAQGVIAHELGHYYHYDTDASLICNVAINTVTFPLMIVTFITRVLSYIPFLGIAAGLYGLLLTVFGAITGIIFNLINLIFYWIDGKWAERSADMFSVDLGYGFGNYLFLSKYTEGFSLRALISGFLDVHPGIRSRCRYIRKRIIRYFGEDYWDSCVAIYGDYYV